MTKILPFLGCLLVVVNAGTYGGQKNGGKKIGLEDIERDLSSNQKVMTNIQLKASSTAVPSPTKFGFVPKRTASSYAAVQPKTQYLQTYYNVKQSAYQPQQPQYNTAYTQPQTTYQQQYVAGGGSSQASDNTEVYSSANQQYISQTAAQDYAYVQPEQQQQNQQQYVIQYEQPGQQYEQYENVQYVTDNSIAQKDSQDQQYYAQVPQPQYYYVQQYQAPSTAVESVIDPKTFQYLSYVPQYSPNAIPIDQKQTAVYSSSSSEPQLPPIATTVAKYTTVVPRKSSSSKQQVSIKDIQYVIPSSAKTQHHKHDEILFKREPKSLLDSYVPSILQLQYLNRQGKSGGYTKF